MKKKVVKVHRDMTVSELAQSKRAMEEAIEMCGGRLNLAHVSGVSGQELSNCLYKSRVSPQIAIRIELALAEKGGEFSKFTRNYFCPDLIDMDFDRVKASMDIDESQ